MVRDINYKRPLVFYFYIASATAEAVGIRFFIFYFFLLMIFIPIYVLISFLISYVESYKYLSVFYFLISFFLFCFLFYFIFLLLVTIFVLFCFVFCFFINLNFYYAVIFLGKFLFKLVDLLESANLTYMGLSLSSSFKKDLKLTSLPWFDLFYLSFKLFFSYLGSAVLYIFLRVYYVLFSWIINSENFNFDITVFKILNNIFCAFYLSFYKFISGKNNLYVIINFLFIYLLIFVFHIGRFKLLIICFFFW